MGGKLKPVPATSESELIRSPAGDEEERGDALTLPELRLGRRLLELRNTRGVTLGQLASDTKFTKGYLSKIENSKVIPSIGTLVKIAHALDSDLVDLFGPSLVNDRELPVHIDRARDRNPTIRGGGSFGYNYIALADKRRHKHMEPFIMIFPPDIEKDGSFDHEGEEFMFILTGRVELSVVVSGRVHTFILSAGDSAFFDSSLPHRGRSLQGESRALVIIYRSERNFVPPPHEVGP